MSKKETNPAPKADTKKAKKEALKFKPIVMWMVLDNDYPDQPVSFTATHEEALMALDQHIYLKHYSHFRHWCPLHGLPIDHADSWIKYSRTVLKEELREDGKPLYTIVQINYEPNVIASLLRSFNRCVPMGLPFDTQEEITEFCSHIDDPTVVRSPIELAFEQLLQDIENDEIAESAEIKAHCQNLFNPPKDANTDDKGGKYDA